MIDHDALDRRDHDVAGPLFRRFAGGALDRSGQPNGIVFGFVTHLLQERRLRLVDGHLADSLQGDDLLLACPTKFLPLGLELLLLDQQLPIAFLEHVRALIELLVTLQQPMFQVAKVGALGATLFLQLALEPDLLLLGLQDEVLLLGARLRDDAAGLVLGSLDGLVGDDTARYEADDQGADDRRHDDHDGDDIVHRSLPSGPRIRRYVHRQIGGWEPLAR